MSAEVSRYQNLLRTTWLAWLGYRLLGLPLLVSLFAVGQPAYVGGVVWQAIWLVPALLFTPWLVKGKSVYVLLIASLYVLVYLGASGFVVFDRAIRIDALGSPGLLLVYILDFILLLLICIWLFLLLKKMPAMHKQQF